MALPDKALERIQRAGWGIPYGSQRLHYFRAGERLSLCLKHDYFDGERTDGKRSKFLKCTTCVRLLARPAKRPQ